MKIEIDNPPSHPTTLNTSVAMMGGAAEIPEVRYACIGSIVEPGEPIGKHRQEYDVLRCGEVWIVLMPRNLDSCAPSAHRIRVIREDEECQPGAWWRQQTIALLDTKAGS